MSGSLIINGLMIFFSVTTVAVLLYPIIRLTPSWLEGSLGKRIAFHRAAAGALEAAMKVAHDDRGQFDRLKAQHDFHRASLAMMAPSGRVAPEDVPQRVDAAA